MNFKDKFSPIVTEIDHSNLGYEASRREQARLGEELAQRERALGETHIRSIHEVEELKRAQEMRIDEFSRQEVRESQATAQELKSQIQELKERMNIMNNSKEFHEVPHFQSTGICSKSSWYADQRPKPATCYMELAWFIGKRF